MEQKNNNYGRDQNVNNYIYFHQLTDSLKQNPPSIIKFDEDDSLRGEVHEIIEIKRRAIPAIVYFAFSIIVPLISTWTGFPSFLSLQTSYIPVVLYAFAIFVFTRNRKYIIIFLNIEKLKQRDQYIGGSRFVRQITASSYEVYGVSANCSYPECRDCGKIYLVPPPEVGEFPRKFVGECSIGGKDHTYRVDANLIGSPQLFDWSKKKDRK